MNNIPVSDLPRMDECMSIVEDFMIERQTTNTLGDDRTVCKARIPFIVTSEIISLDTEKIDEMGLFCPHEEKHRTFDDTTIQLFPWGGQYSESGLSDNPEWERKFYREQIIESIARDVYAACKMGFLTCDVHGTREERIEREPVSQTMTEYVEGSDLPDVDLPETEERQYAVGTRRYGIDGVVNDRFWWETSLDAARRERVKGGMELTCL